MSGVEHYHRAERLLADAESGDYLPGEAAVERDRRRTRQVTLAQVHATLALAAASSTKDYEEYGR